MDEATHKKNFKPINIRDLFMDKNPSLARWIPGFVSRRRKGVITFGKPIPRETFDKRFTPLEWA